jgi:hypothetical protein
MIKLKPALLLLLLFLSMYSNAVVVPVAPGPSTLKPFEIRPRAVEKITGKKLTLFQKFKWTLAQKALRKYGSEELTARQKKQATVSMILGFLGLALLLLTSAVGGFAILCIPASILAIVFGSESLRGNHNTQGIIGVVTGGLTIGIILLAIILFIGSGGFNFG